MSLRFGQKIQALPRCSELSASPSSVHVVAGIVFDAWGNVLLAQRPPERHLAGFWEFPGGKLEPRESQFAGLVRELREELAISVERARPLHRVSHRYPERQVLIDFWRVQAWSGQCRALDGQAFKWCAIATLSEIGIAPADGPVLSVLRLGERFEFDAAREPAAGLRGALCTNLVDTQTATAGGAQFLVFRSPPPAAELGRIRERVVLPIYARGRRTETSIVELQTSDLLDERVTARD